MDTQNVNRTIVKQLVALCPGIHLRKLQKLMGVSFSTTRYHVNNLVRDGEIVCSASTGYNRLYPTGTSDEMKAVFACLQSRTVRRVLRLITDLPLFQPTPGELADVVSLPKSTLSEALAALQRVGLVRRSFTPDARVVYDIVDRDLAFDLLRRFDKTNILNAASDKFIDLWDI